MDVRTEIQAELNRVEQENGVCIVYACESGSRAWGFESSDSDYDVRFIYVHPTEWYLRVMHGNDVIERPANELLDVSGWDLRKSLQLLRKSNPPHVTTTTFTWRKGTTANTFRATRSG